MSGTLILSSKCNSEFGTNINPKLIKNINEQINKKFKDKKRHELKMTVIATPKLNLYKRARSREYLFKKCKIIAKNYSTHLKIPVTTIDCSKKENIPKFKHEIENSDIILVLGGDTFYLMYHLKKSKMDHILYKRVKNNNVIYIGCCSGSIISGSTIFPTYIYRRYPHMAKKYTLNNIYQSKYFTSKKNQKALNFIKNHDVLTYCHNDKIKNKTKKKVIKLNKSKKFVCLHNSESLIVDL